MDMCQSSERQPRRSPHVIALVLAATNPLDSELVGLDPLHSGHFADHVAAALVLRTLESTHSAPPLSLLVLGCMAEWAERTSM